MAITLAEIIWNAPGLWPLAIVIALVIGVVVAMLYLPQARTLGQPWRWLLPLLRICGLAALAISILKPVAVRQATPAESGGILIVVDRSRSMSVRDLSHLPEEIPKGHATAAAGHLVSLADGLGMLPRGARDSHLAEMQREVGKLSGLFDDLTRARNELDFARVAGQGADAAKARVKQASEQFKIAANQLVDESASISKSAGYIKKITAQLAELIRGNPDAWPVGAVPILSELTAAVDQTQGAADLSLYQANPDVRAACAQIAGMSRFERVEHALTDPNSGLLGKFPEQVPLFGYSVADDARALPLRGAGQPVRQLLVQPDGLRSNLAAGLRAALTQIEGQPLQAIIFFSDGRQTEAEPGVPSALTAAGVPIFSVYSANRPRELPMHDVSVSSLTAPASCFVGETVTARVELHSAGFKSNPAATQIRLAIDDAEPTTRPAALNDETVAQQFPLKFDKPGIHRIVASIPSPADAPTSENKKLERWIKVLSDKVHVGLYAGSAGWDFQYVRDGLSRTAWIDLKDSILSADDAKFPLTPEQILDLDLLMLFDVPAAALTEQQWDAVYKLVSERGGSVILIAGDEHIPFEYADRQMPSSFLPYLAEQKPVWRTWPGKSPGFHIIPAPGTGTLDALKLDDNETASAANWAQLPAFYRYLSLPELKPNARALLIDRDSSAPVLLESRLGLGKSFFFGATETWRWRYKIGSKLQDRFWLQLVRYAADEPYAVQNKMLALDANPVSAEPDQTIKIRARVSNADGSPSTAPRQEVQLLKDGQVMKTLALAAAGSSGSGRYRGVLQDVAAGDYQLRLNSSGGGEAVDLPLHVAPSLEIEMANLDGSDFLLRRMSDATGGTFMTLDQVSHLPELISKSRATSAQLMQRPLWDSYYLFFFVLACFAAEWAIRKRVGLL